MTCDAEPAPSLFPFSEQSLSPGSAVPPQPQGLSWLWKQTLNSSGAEISSPDCAPGRADPNPALPWGIHKQRHSWERPERVFWDAAAPEQHQGLPPSREFSATDPISLPDLAEPKGEHSEIPSLPQVNSTSHTPVLAMRNFPLNFGLSVSCLLEISPRNWHSCSNQCSFSAHPA